MKILIAPDSFKGALSAPGVASAIAEGVHRVFPNAETVLLPVADGGEGTLEALLVATQGTWHTETVMGALGEPQTAQWGVLGDGETAVIELAQSAGLTQVPPERRDPKVTTTYGVGQVLKSAYQKGLRRFIVGLGGSATNDGGAGLLSALGVQLRDRNGHLLPPGGANLLSLAQVDYSELVLDPTTIDLTIACDVDNPLVGERGASAVFGPQKGATASDILLLDSALAHYASVLGFPPDTPGVGAAGGTAYGLLALFPQATLRPGIAIVLEAIRFEKHLAGADLVLTGEGRLDSQTLGGKVVAGIARSAQAAGVPVGVLVGGVSPEITGTQLTATGIGAILPIAPGPCTLTESIAHTASWLSDAAERALRWVRIGKDFHDTTDETGL